MIKNNSIKNGEILMHCSKHDALSTGCWDFSIPLISEDSPYIHAERCLSVHESKDGEADRVRGMELAAQPIHSPL